jgi:hypothetical protein
VVVARQETLSQEKPVDIVRRLFGPEHGIGLDIPQRGASSKRPPPDFSGGRLKRTGRPLAEAAAVPRARARDRPSASRPGERPSSAALRRASRTGAKNLAISAYPYAFSRYLSRRSDESVETALPRRHCRSTRERDKAARPKWKPKRRLPPGSLLALASREADRLSPKHLVYQLYTRTLNRIAFGRFGRGIGVSTG